MSEEVKYPEGCTKVLNHGFVRLVDSMGSDQDIIDAARVSYGKGTKRVNEDRGLIRYLMRNLHTTPFEMVEFKFHIRMPIFVMRQWIRHRTASVNEYSLRYSEAPDLFYIPEIEQVTKQSTVNKQGGSDTLVDDPIKQIGLFHLDCKEAYVDYQDRLKTGMRKELARINLPFSTYTEAYWKIDLHNLFHFLKLRLDSHAQYEIRVYGEAMAEMVKAVVPMAWEAFEDYHVHSMRLSRLEIEQLKKVLTHRAGSDYIKEVDWGTVFGNKREGEEFAAKLQKLAA